MSGVTTPMTLRNRIGLAVMLAGTFVAVMDNYIVNVAIPAMQRNLGASFAEAEFIIAAYLLTFATGLITGGRLGDIYGRRRMFLVGMAGFVGASTLCGIAPTPSFLILARLLQGLAAAVLSPQVMALLRVTFANPRQRATAFSLMGVTIGLATVIGQVLGGFIVEADIWGLAWRPVFLINIPIGLLTSRDHARGVGRIACAGGAGAGYPRHDPVHRRARAAAVSADPRA